MPTNLSEPSTSKLRLSFVFQAVYDYSINILSGILRLRHPRPVANYEAYVFLIHMLYGRLATVQLTSI